MPTTVGDIIGVYKSIVFDNCFKIYKQRNQVMGKLWQRNYHEHIIRDKKSLQTIINYIKTNPKNRDKDLFYVPYLKTS